MPEAKAFVFEDFLETNKFVIALLIVGLLLIGLGVFGFKLIDFKTSQPQVEIVKTETPTEVVVEIAGEILKPGVYNLSSESRINDLLIMAGGLSANADRAWVEKNLNLAQKLEDGVKIFIPSVDQNSQVSDQVAGGKINLNIASAAELDSLWGIGPATAQKIISQRPFKAIEDLLAKKIVNQDTWKQIKDKIKVY